MHEEPRNIHPIPPHLRKQLVQVEFEEEDLQVLAEVYQNMDEAVAAEASVMIAPPEQQIVVLQLIKLIKEVVA